MRKLDASLLIAFCTALALAFAGGAARTSAVTLDISFTATNFFGWSPVDPTWETPPVAQIVGSLSVTSEGEHFDLEGQLVEPGEVRPLVVPLTALDLEIAGRRFAAEDSEAYVGFVAGQLAQVTAGARIKPPDVQGPGGLAQYPGWDDWSLTLRLEDPRYPDEPPSLEFSFSTAESVSLFGSYSLEVSLSVDGGPPRQFVYEVPPCIEDATLCYGAHPSPGDPPALADASFGPSVGVKPGAMLCEGAGSDEARSSGAATGLRDVRIARGDAARAEHPNLPRHTKLATALGALTLELKAVDRLLLAAAQGTSAAVEPPAASPGSELRCARARTARGTPRFQPRRNVLVEAASGKLAYYHVRKPTRVCAGAAKPGSSDLLLCYRARPAAGGKARSETWVAHALGVEHLRVAGTGEICLRAEPSEPD
jgi:hypothetical protein